MNTKISVDVILEKQACRECGGIYALTEGYIGQRREKGGHWHCPYCDTSWLFTETEIMQLKKQLDEEFKRTMDEKQKTKDALAEAKHFKKSRDAMKGQITKVKNRVEKGICPHCNRYFKNLHKHMKSKHTG